MRPRISPRTTKTPCMSSRELPACFNEAAAFHRGQPDLRLHTRRRIAVASMRPRHFTADIQGVSVAQTEKQPASMRPRHLVAETEPYTAVPAPREFAWSFDVGIQTDVLGYALAWYDNANERARDSMKLGLKVSIFGNYSVLLSEACESQCATCRSVRKSP
jgi:hypothetical protein